jgi:hypothetical protein
MKRIPVEGKDSPVPPYLKKDSQVANVIEKVNE